MDGAGNFWHFPAMTRLDPPIPAWQLYGEDAPFPDLLHIERIVDRARGHDWRIETHQHVALHQIFLFISGQIRPIVAGVPWAVSTPCLLNLPRLTPHSFGFSAGTEGFVLTLAAPDFPELLAPDAPAAAPLSLAFAATAPPGMALAFEALATAHATPHPLRPLRLRAGALALGLAAAETAGSDLAAPAQQDPRLLRLEALVRQHLASGWQLADYAGALGLSERHLRRLCRSQTGQSAHALIEVTHLREACRLLAYTRMRVQEVGFATGFDDPAYFARTFRRRMGLSPRAYRDRLDR